MKQKTQETWVRSLGLEDPLEEGMATHSSVLAWRTPWTEEPGGLQSSGSQSQTRLKQLSMHACKEICVVLLEGEGGGPHKYNPEGRDGISQDLCYGIMSAQETKTSQVRRKANLIPDQRGRNAQCL